MRFPFEEEGRGEYTNIPERKIKDSTNIARHNLEEDNLEWWRIRDREKEALKLETNDIRRLIISKTLEERQLPQTEYHHRMHEYEETSSESDQEEETNGKDNKPETDMTQPENIWGKFYKDAQKQDNERGG